jgi:hypothetical protein
MKVKDLDNITGTLSKPSKMPGFAYGIPAKGMPDWGEAPGGEGFNLLQLLRS